MHLELESAHHNKILSYDSSTGNLSYDLDGAGTAFSAVKFANLSNRPAASELNIWVV